MFETKELVTGEQGNNERGEQATKDVKIGENADKINPRNNKVMAEDDLRGQSEK